jgi:dTDP-4-dehydrorhamnose reductase
MVVEACRGRGLAHVAMAHGQLDVSSPEAVREALERLRPWAVINCAARSGVDYAERHPGVSRQANAIGPAVLAESCAGRGVKLLTFSSDLVFNGLAGRPYTEADLVQPLNEYGRTKADGERMVLQALPGALVVRTGPLFGLTSERDPVTSFLRNVAAGRAVRFAEDEVVSPTYAPDLVQTVLDLLVDDAEGVWHVASGGAVSWAEFARLVARAAGIDEGRVVGAPGVELLVTAVRPAMSALVSLRHRLMPSLESAVARCVAGASAEVLRQCGELGRSVGEARVA